MIKNYEGKLIDVDNHNRLRDEIAMAALMGMLAMNAHPNARQVQIKDVSVYARDAYIYADAMLKAREGKMNKIIDIEEAKKKFIIGSKWYDEEGYIWEVVDHKKEFISLKSEDDYFILLFEGSTDDFVRCENGI